MQPQTKGFKALKSKQEQQACGQGLNNQLLFGICRFAESRRLVYSRLRLTSQKSLEQIQIFTINYV